MHACGREPGNDRRFRPAEVVYREVGKDDRGRPKLDQKQLVLTSALVPAPRHFRYAWGRNPLANLQAIGNKDLPFATQRSDDWGMGEVPLGVLGDGVDGKGELTRAQQGKVRQELRREHVRRRFSRSNRPRPRPVDRSERAAADACAAPAAR